MTNYRPISITGNLARVVEKIIKVRINKYFTKNKIMSDLKFGFKSNISAQDALTQVVSHIQSALDNNE